MLSFKEYISEALIDISREDINKIYSPISKAIKELSAFLNRDPESWQSGESEEIIGKYQNWYKPIKVLNSSILKSKEASLAHELSPVTINLYLFLPPEKGNSYVPIKNEINIGIPSVIRGIINYKSHTLNTHLKDIIADASEIKLKSTIRHELTHWIDDTLHNRHITNMIVNPKFIKQVNTAFAANHRKDIRYLMPHEITAMVNQIAELKRRLGDKKYNSLTWVELVALIPGLNSLNVDMGQEWRKLMFTRLAREKLVGTNFTKKLS
jgi:hypothetical protein